MSLKVTNEKQLNALSLISIFAYNILQNILKSGLNNTYISHRIKSIHLTAETVFYYAIRAGFSFFSLTNQLVNCQLTVTGGLSLDALFNRSVT